MTDLVLRGETVGDLVTDTMIQGCHVREHGRPISLCNSTHLWQTFTAMSRSVRVHRLLNAKPKPIF